MPPEGSQVLEVDQLDGQRPFLGSIADLDEVWPNTQLDLRLPGHLEPMSARESDRRSALWSRGAAARRPSSSNAYIADTSRSAEIVS
jgi:hypothetical protein